MGKKIKIGKPITLLKILLNTVEGIHQDGQIQIAELPQNLAQSIQENFLQPGKG